MTEYAQLDLPDDPKLVQNITWFARALRKAGLPVGPGRVIDAIRAVQAAGFSGRADFYWTLHACFVSRPEHRAVFAHVFRLYWRDPRYLEHMMSMLTPTVRGVQEERAAQAGENARQRPFWTGWKAMRLSSRSRKKTAPRSKWMPRARCPVKKSCARLISNR